MDKQNEFNDKRAALLNQPNSKNYATSYDDEKKRRTAQFREASTVEIFFEFNPGVGVIHSSGGGDEEVTNYNLPGAVFAKSVHNPYFDPYTMAWHFDQWENFTVLLFGRWISKTDQDKNYEAIFTLNKQDDEYTLKKIRSDKVQTIAVHIMGSKTNVDKLTGLLDANKLNAAVYKAN